MNKAMYLTVGCFVFSFQRLFLAMGYEFCFSPVYLSFPKTSVKRQN